MGNLKILRLAEAMDRLGISETSWRTAVNAGLLPKPIKLSERTIGFPEHELNQVIRSRIAGLLDADIKKLVERIHEDRARMADELLGNLA